MAHNNQAVLAVSKEPNPTRYQKTLGINDFYFGGPGFDFPLGNIQMVGKSQAPMFRGEKRIAKLAPLFTLDELAKHAVDFWLCTEDLPRPDNRVTLESDGNIRLTLHARPTRCPTKRLYDQLKSMLGHLGMHPDHLIPRNLYLKNEMDDRRGRAPGRHLPVRHRSRRPRCWTSTARRTSWTTSTSSTPASSRASAR